MLTNSKPLNRCYHRLMMSRWLMSVHGILGVCITAAVTARWCCSPGNSPGFSSPGLLMLHFGSVSSQSLPNRPGYICRLSDRRPFCLLDTNIIWISFWVFFWFLNNLPMMPAKLENTHFVLPPLKWVLAVSCAQVSLGGDRVRQQIGGGGHQLSYCCGV